MTATERDQLYISEEKGSGNNNSMIPSRTIKSPFITFIHKARCDPALYKYQQDLQASLTLQKHQQHTRASFFFYYLSSFVTAITVTLLHLPLVTFVRMQYQTASWGGYMAGGGIEPVEKIERMASENAVVIFSISTCCMCHAMKRLLCGMGVNPTVHELDQDPAGKELERALVRILGTPSVVPVVFIGGKLVGTMDRVMASHINGTLVPLLKQAGALWL